MYRILFATLRLDIFKLKNCHRGALQIFYQVKTIDVLSAVYIGANSLRYMKLIER